MPAIWDKYWGYLYKQNIAPIMMGEFGSTLPDPQDKVWLEKLMAYTGTGVNGMSFTYWSWNPNSGDTGGIALRRLDHDQPAEAGDPPAVPDPAGRWRDRPDRYPDAEPHHRPRAPPTTTAADTTRRPVAAPPPTSRSTPGRVASRAS